MSLAILGLGTAVPRTRLNLSEAIQAATAVCSPNDHHARLVTAYFEHTGIQGRHTVLAPEVFRDVLDGTRHTESNFLPTGCDDDAGPTTAERMTHYATNAPPLAIFFFRFSHHLPKDLLAPLGCPLRLGLLRELNQLHHPRPRLARPLLHSPRALPRLHDRLLCHWNLVIESITDGLMMTHGSLRTRFHRVRSL